MNRMDGKVCVVTGSTQGLGAAIARRLAEAGAAGLVTLGRNEAKGACRGRGDHARHRRAGPLRQGRPRQGRGLPTT